MIDFLELMPTFSKSFKAQAVKCLKNIFEGTKSGEKLEGREGQF